MKFNVRFKRKCFLPVLCAIILVLIYLLPHEETDLKRDSDLVVENEIKAVVQASSGRSQIDYQTDPDYFVDVPKVVTKQVNPVTTPTPYPSHLDEVPKLFKELYDKGWLEPASDICDNKYEDLLFVTIVISAPDHFDQRDAIRQSWAKLVQQSQSSALVFLAGQSEGDDFERLAKEAQDYGDVAITNVVDVYENMSLKVGAAFQWFQDHCARAKFLLKVDDDVFIQMRRVRETLKGILRSPHRGQPLILGNVASGWKPGRDKSSKYYVSEAYYSQEVYPDFVTGPSYILSRQAVTPLLALAWEHPYIPLEDVFFTGILAETAQIPRRMLQELRNNAERIPAKFLGCTLLRTISIHKVLPEEQEYLTNLAQRPVCQPHNSPGKKLGQRVPGAKIREVKINGGVAAAFSPSQAPRT